MAEVSLDRVTKVFPGGTVAVDSVSLDVADGELAVDLTGAHFFDPETTDAIPVVAGEPVATAGLAG